MKIGTGINAAVVVRRDWVNLHWVRAFLRRYDQPQREVRGDESHTIFARVLESDDPHGLWIELNTTKHAEDPSIDRLTFLVPWGEVLAVPISEKAFPADIQEEARKMGFAPPPNEAG